MSNVVAVDVRNEVRCDGSQCPNWGQGGIYDWQLAAEWIGNAIHEINPELLVSTSNIRILIEMTSRDCC